MMLSKNYYETLTKVDNYYQSKKSNFFVTAYRSEHE